MAEEMKTKDEEVNRLLQENKEYQSTVKVLKNELDLNRRSDKEMLLRLETQKKEIEHEYQETIHSLESELQNSYEKLKNLEANAEREMSNLKLKDTQYQNFLSSQLLEYKVHNGSVSFYPKNCKYTKCFELSLLLFSEGKIQSHIIDRSLNN